MAILNLTLTDYIQKRSPSLQPNTRQSIEEGLTDIPVEKQATLTPLDIRSNKGFNESIPTSGKISCRENGYCLWHHL